MRINLDPVADDDACGDAADVSVKPKRLSLVLVNLSDYLFKQGLLGIVLTHPPPFSGEISWSGKAHYAWRWRTGGSSRRLMFGLTRRGSDWKLAPESVSAIGVRSRPRSSMPYAHEHPPPDAMHIVKLETSMRSPLGSRVLRRKPCT